MGVFASLRDGFLWNLRTQTPVGGQWLGEQLRLLFPGDLSDVPEGAHRLAILAPLDKWALYLAPEKYLGRLRRMVDVWVRQTSKEEVERAASRIGDAAWLWEAARQVNRQDPGNGWLGVGLMMLQGAFKSAGLIAHARRYDEFKFEVTVDWT